MSTCSHKHVPHLVMAGFAAENCCLRLPGSWVPTAADERRMQTAESHHQTSHSHIPTNNEGIVHMRHKDISFQTIRPLVRCGEIRAANIVRFSVSWKAVFAWVPNTHYLLNSPLRKENHPSRSSFQVISALRKAKVHSFI